MRHADRKIRFFRVWIAVVSPDSQTSAWVGKSDFESMPDKYMFRDGIHATGHEYGIVGEKNAAVYQ
jgi:hypothetical protein